MAQEKTQQFDLSLKSIFLLYLPFLLIIAFYYFRRLILIGLLSVIIASLLDRPINALEKNKKSFIKRYFGLSLALGTIRSSNFVSFSFFKEYFL